MPNVLILNYTFKKVSGPSPEDADSLYNTDSIILNVNRCVD